MVENIVNIIDGPKKKILELICFRNLTLSSLENSFSFFDLITIPGDKNEIEVEPSVSKSFFVIVSFKCNFAP